MKKMLLVSAFAFSLCANASAQNEQLYGTWRLVSSVRTIDATGETEENYGKAPKGFIHYGRDGRMMVIIVADLPRKPSHSSVEEMTDEEIRRLLMTMTAYSGTFSFDGKTVTHHVDVSSNELYTDTILVRDVRFDGDRAIFATRPAPSPRDGRLSTTVLVWEKLK